MMAVAGIAALVLIVIAVSRATAHAGEKQKAEDAAARIVAEANATSDPDRLDAYAAELERAGYAQTAEVLRRRAAEIRARAAAHEAARLSSPLPEASDAAWSRFESLMAAGTPYESVLPGGYLGRYRMGLPRLATLGYVTNLHRDRASGKWLADWVPPLTLRAFLGSPKVQYEAFVRSIRADRRAILERHPDAVGRTLAGQVATLSGLLAATRQAGLRGLDEWLASGGDRGGHPRTTSAYLHGNGVF